MLTIGLTGGIASGKSSVAAQFTALGVPIIDTDLIARELVMPGQPALQALLNTLARKPCTPTANSTAPGYANASSATRMSARHSTPSCTHAFAPVSRMN